MLIRYRTLSRYLIKEIFTYFLLTTLVFSILFVMGKTFELARLIVRYHIGLGVILKLLFYALPYFLSYILPISALLSTLLTFLRFTQDKEYTAIRAAGISPKSFFPILCVFAMFCLITTLFVTSIIFPYGYKASKKLLFSLAQKKVEIAFKPGVFSNPIPGIIFYIDRIESDELKGVFLYDGRNTKNQLYQNQLIIAKSGFVDQEDNKIIFYFKNGYILKNAKPTEKLANHFLSYQKYTFTVETANRRTKRWRNPKEYYIWELWGKINEPKKDTGFILVFHHNIVLPITAFIFVFLGTVLGLREERKKHIGGVLWGIIWLTIYQALFLAGKTMGKTQIISPHVCLWIPNLIMGGITLYFWYRVIND